MIERLDILISRPHQGKSTCLQETTKKWKTIKHTFLAWLGDVHFMNRDVLKVGHSLLLGYNAAIFRMTCKIRTVRYGEGSREAWFTLIHDI